MSDPVSCLMQLLAAGKYEETIFESQKLLDGDPSLLDTGSFLYLIGCAKKELGEIASALSFLLEAHATFPITEPLLIGHVQDEIARIQLNLKFYTSALFFVEMAISNFELGGNPEMKASCEALREEILRRA